MKTINVDLFLKTHSISFEFFWTKKKDLVVLVQFFWKNSGKRLYFRLQYMSEQNALENDQSIYSSVIFKIVFLFLIIKNPS
jgi:hypothetical protein